MATSAGTVTRILALGTLFVLSAGCGDDDPTKVKSEPSTTSATSIVTTTTIQTQNNSVTPSSTSAPATSNPTYPPPTAPPVTSTVPTQAPAVYYKNCTEARSAGAAPVRVGDPGYASHLDRDGDGVGCE